MTIRTKYLSITFLLLTFSYAINAQQGQVKITQDREIDKLLEFKKDLKTSKVYRIQVYQSVDLDLAQREKDNFLNSYDEWPVEIVWNTPNYKVWVGNFASRIEADRADAKIKDMYMNTNVIQPRKEN